MNPLKLTLALSVVLFGCQTARKAGPEAYLPQPSDNIETITLFGINDLHGALTPQSFKSREMEGTSSTSYERGGAAILATHVRHLQGLYGNRLLLLDAGDCFQGSLESNLQEGAPMVAFYNSLGWTAAAVGNHEFDFGPIGAEGSTGDVLGALKARMKESRYSWVASNIVDRSTGKLPDFPNTSTGTIVQAGRAKVGIIGLSTLQTPTVTRPDFVKGLEFTPLKDAVLRESARLRKEGAQVIVATAHVGLFCDLGGAKPGHQIRTAKDPLGKCEPDAEMVKLLKAIPAGTLDAVVSGHSHSVVHHWVNGTPVIQAGTRGAYYNLIHLTYDLKAKRVIAEETRIEGPVPVCPKVFANQGDCNGDAPPPKEGRGGLVTAVVHGQAITPDPTTERLVEPILARVEEAKKRVIGTVERTIEVERQKESSMGNLVADAIRTQAGADVALMNNGGIRAPFEYGPLTYGDLFKTLPFDNFVAVVQVTGRELKQILQVAESGAKGFFPVSGVKLTILHPDVPTKGRDLNGDGRTDLWEIDRLVSVRLSNGAAIDDRKLYRLATIDFLIQGGDDMGWVFSRIPKERIEMQAGGMLRDAAERYISRLGVLNTAAQPLVDEKNPRIQFTRVASTKSGSPKRRSKTRR